MPALDTQVLFALTPRDPKHVTALRIIKSRRDLVVTDTAMLEFQSVFEREGKEVIRNKGKLLSFE